MVLNGIRILTTYYGQLSHMKIKPNEKFQLDELMKIDKDYAEQFTKKS